MVCPKITGISYLASIYLHYEEMYFLVDSILKPMNQEYKPQ